MIQFNVFSHDATYCSVTESDVLAPLSAGFFRAAFHRIKNFLDLFWDSFTNFPAVFLVMNCTLFFEFVHDSMNCYLVWSFPRMQALGSAEPSLSLLNVLR